MTYTEARYIYELERQLPARNFAKDHSFEEWLDWRLKQGDCN
jgi:hypothetical protein